MVLLGKRARLSCISLLALLLVGSAQADAVIDGNTLEIRGERVRLFGIDAFELAQTCLDARGEPWRCGVDAKAALADLVQDHPVACRVMVEDPDGGYVARCRGRDDIDVGGYMVSLGLALAERRASDDYVDEEAAAQSEGKGVWPGIFIPPWEWQRLFTK